MDAVVLAAGRLTPAEAARAGHEIKALIRIGDDTPLGAMLSALARTHHVARVVLVAPQSLRTEVNGYHDFIIAGASAEENALIGLRSVTTRRVLLCSSDLPFVESVHIHDFLTRVPHDADIAYPIYERSEFLAVFPEGRTKFARVGGAQFTGGSLCVITPRVALANERLLRQAFAARRSQIAMASFLGPGILVRHLSNTLRVQHVEDRVERLTGGKAVAVRGAHPALAMDCDSIVDVEYARLAAGNARSHAPR